MGDCESMCVLAGKMDTIIISGFYGIGKSECARANPGCIDLEAKSYAWKTNESGKFEKDAAGQNIRNPDFPNNYMRDINEQIGKVPIICVSTRIEVRDALVRSGMPFTLVYPERGLRADYIRRCEKRGSPREFVNFLETRWDELLADLEAQPGCDKIVLAQGQFLGDVISHIKPGHPADDSAIAVQARGLQAA